MLDAIEADRTRKAKEFEENKKELGELILAKEAELRKIQAQIEEMSDFAQRRAAQEQEVSELQETIQSLEEQHERGVLWIGCRPTVKRRAGDTYSKRVPAVAFQRDQPFCVPTLVPSVVAAICSLSTPLLSGFCL